MEKPTFPQANFSALDDERGSAARRPQDPRLERAAAHWEGPSSKRKFIPAIVIGVAVAGLAAGMEYKFGHKAGQAPQALAQGPAVESMINEAPPAAGTPAEPAAPAVEQRTEATPPDTTPAAAPPPPPTAAPRAERAAPRAIPPAPRPTVPDAQAPQRSAPTEAPVQQAPAVTPSPEAPPPAQQAIQPPSPMPTPEPAPEAPISDKPSGL